MRLSRRQRGSSYIVALLSLYVIALSLLPNILDLKPFQNQILLACSVVLSVFVIFTSLIDGAQNFYHQGELLHQCARKIATIHHELKNIDIVNDRVKAEARLIECQAEYRQALDECPINHDNVDYLREMGWKAAPLSRQLSRQSSSLAIYLDLVQDQSGRPSYYLDDRLCGRFWDYNNDCILLGCPGSRHPNTLSGQTLTTGGQQLHESIGLGGLRATRMAAPASSIIHIRSSQRAQSKRSGVLRH